MKMDGKSYWLKSGFYTLMERGCTVLFNFGSFYLLVRTFTKTEFGIWTLFLTVSAFIEVARSGLIQNAQIKFLAVATDDEKPVITTASLTLNVMLTLISIGVLVVMSQTLGKVWNAPAMQGMFLQYIFTTIALIPYTQFNFIQQANMDFKGIFWGSFVRQGSFFCYNVCCYMFDIHFTLARLVQFQTVAALLGAIVSFWFVRRYLKLVGQIDWAWVGKLFGYGKFVFGTNLSSMVYKSLDQMMLGTMVSPASVAIYNTAVKITNLMEVPTASVAAVVFPKSVKLGQSQGLEAVKHLYEKSVGFILALMLPCVVFVMLFPKFVIMAIAGPQYLDTVYLLQITILYSLYIPFARQFGTILDAIGKPKVNFYFLLFSVSLNFTLNYIFISRFGVVGAAYGSLTTFTICFILNQVILYRILNVRTLNAVGHARSFYRSGYSSGLTFLRQKLNRNQV